MTTDIEIEIKVLLDSDDYYTILEFLNLLNEFYIEQVNTYLDTRSQSLSKNGYNLRCRCIEKDDFYELTVKTPAEEGNVELNEIIDKAKFDSIIISGHLPKCQLSSYLGDIHEKIIPLATLKTKRYEIDYDGGKLCIDHNFYNGIEDFELEYEGKSLQHCYHVIDNLFDDLKLQYEVSTLSKRSRAINSINK